MEIRVYPLFVMRVKIDFSSGDPIKIQQNRFMIDFFITFLPELAAVNDCLIQAT